MLDDAISVPFTHLIVLSETYSCGCNVDLEKGRSRVMGSEAQQRHTEKPLQRISLFYENSILEMAFVVKIILDE